MDRIYPVCSKCLQSKVTVIIIAVWGLIAGLMYFVDSLVIALVYLHKAHQTALRYAFYSIELLMIDYIYAMLIIFSCYLIYGVIRNSPRKSAFIYAWFLYACSSAAADILSLLITLLFFHALPWEYVTEECILLFIQLCSLLMVYGHYRATPKPFESIM